MRFGEIYRICKDNYGIINDNYLQLVDTYRKYVDISKSRDEANLKKYNVDLHMELKTLGEIASKTFGDLKCLEKAVDKVYPLKSSRPVTIEQEINNVKELLIQLECIIKLYESLRRKKHEIGLDIRIPETDDITEFKKYISELEFVLTKCPFFQIDEANLKFRSVDIGSTWLIIAIASTSASASLIAVSTLLNNIVAFIDKCIGIKSHRLTCEKQEQEIKKSEYDQKKKEQLIETVLEVYKISVSNAIRELEDTTGCHMQDGDERGRAEQSLEKLEKLIDKGLQIYASIDSPPETKALFEPLEMHYLSIAEELKRIEKKSDDGDKE